MRDFLATQATGDLISFETAELLRQRFNLTCNEVEATILEAGFLPARYQRNRKMISQPRQRQLHHSQVAVIGCGGLGGYVLEELARLGVGHLLAIDPDCFEEHNLNRQLLATSTNRGLAKVEAAVLRIALINPAIRVTPHQASFSSANAAELLGQADVVVDAVDNVATRLELAAACATLQRPLVHGAIAGWYGQVLTLMPGDRSLQQVYGNWQGGAGIEAEQGNPSFTPAVVASLQAAEVCKLLLGCGQVLQNRLLTVDLQTMEMETVALSD